MQGPYRSSEASAWVESLRRIADEVGNEKHSSAIQCFINFVKEEIEHRASEGFRSGRFWLTIGDFPILPEKSAIEQSISDACGGLITFNFDWSYYQQRICSCSVEYEF